MFCRSLAVACLILAASATPAAAQMSGGSPPVTNPTVWESIQINDIAASQLRDDFYDDLDAAYYAMVMGDWWGFQGAIYGMQLALGQYSAALSYSIWEYWVPMVEADPSLAFLAMMYIESKIAEIEAMIAALQELQSYFAATDGWYSVIGTMIGNLESLIANLTIAEFEIMAIVADAEAGPP
jgi:hypothetical protein